MKKIGYIYKYSPSERMGILMFDVWKVKDYWERSIIKNAPILFSANDLVSDISTGQLVYFDLEGITVSNIERASLSNFKVDYINSIIRCKDGELESFFYLDNTFISFEYLDNIIIPNEKSDSITNKDATKYLPNSIVDLYNCFGKYKHNGKESISLNVFDLSLWIDSDVLDTEYFGKKVDELLFLYDIFVLKKHYDKKGNEINEKLENDCISPICSLLLSKLSDSDLREIMYKAPKLQPAMPVEFCKNNVELLTSEYGMPNIEICKLYCQYIITNAKTVSEYQDIKAHVDFSVAPSDRHNNT